MKSKLFIFGLLFLFSACSSLQNSASSDKRTVQQKIEAKDFTIEMSSLIPSKIGREHLLTTGYDLRIKNDTAIAYLPYFGEAYVAPDATDGGIKFESPMRNYVCTPNNKADGWEISFDASNKSAESFRVWISVYDNGRATLNITPSKRSAIYYIGNVK
jgi:hypothetical protein